jgi:hypothetical protein
LNRQHSNGFLPNFISKFFSRQNFFFVILVKGNFFEQKKNWREKINLAKTILPNLKASLCQRWKPNEKLFLFKNLQTFIKYMDKNY